MITLVILFCVTGDVSACQRQRYPLASPLGCAMAQMVATDFVESHGAYHVASWQCGRA